MDEGVQYGLLTILGLATPFVGIGAVVNCDASRIERLRNACMEMCAGTDEARQNHGECRCGRPR